MQYSDKQMLKMRNGSRSVHKSYWRGRENDIQPQVKTRTQQIGLSTLMCAPVTDFTQSEEFLDRMGELPENYHPDYRLEAIEQLNRTLASNSVSTQYFLTIS